MRVPVTLLLAATIGIFAPASAAQAYEACGYDSSDPCVDKSALYSSWSQADAQRTALTLDRLRMQYDILSSLVVLINGKYQAVVKSMR